MFFVIRVLVMPGKKEREEPSAQLATCFGRTPKPVNHVILRNKQPPEVLRSLYLPSLGKCGTSTLEVK